MNKRSALLFVLFTALISGFSIFINKFSVSKIEPYTFTFLKNAVVAVFLISLVFITKEINIFKNLTKKQWLKLVIIGFVGGSIPFLLFFKGLSLTSSAIGSLIHKTMFVYASVFAFLILREKVSKKVLIPIVLLLTGNFLLLNFNSFVFGKGELLILIATLFWALENVLSKSVLKTLQGNVVALGRMFFGSLFILIFLVFTGRMGMLISLKNSDIIWTILTSILLLLFVTSYYNGLKYIKVSTATAILTLGSPITTLLYFMFLDTKISLMNFLGIILIFVGVFTAILFLEFSKEPSINQVSQQHTHNG